jgi:hypothetical protein
MKREIFVLVSILVFGGAMTSLAVQPPLIRQGTSSTPTATLESLKIIQGQLRAEIEKREEEMKTNLEAKRAELRARIELKKKELENRLKKIKEENKRKIVSRIYERVNELNKLLTDHYLDVLGKLEKILERIERRTAKAKLNGVDVSEVEKAISTAKAKIEEARKAVISQAEKVYEPPQITTEQNLKLDVGKLRQQVHSDLKAVEKLVKEAREAVRTAATTLAKIPRVDEFEAPATTTPSATPTESATPSPSSSPSESLPPPPPPPTE